MSLFHWYSSWVSSLSYYYILLYIASFTTLPIDLSTTPRKGYTLCLSLSIYLLPLSFPSIYYEGLLLLSPPIYRLLLSLSIYPLVLSPSILSIVTTPIYLSIATIISSYLPTTTTERRCQHDILWVQILTT